MIRLGISSAGAFVERGVLPRLQAVESIRVTAISDKLEPNRAQALARTFDIDQALNDFEEIINSDLVDAVYVCAPNCFHREMTIAAAEAGKHVICEKPLGLNAAECRAMVEACHACGVTLAVGFCYPHAGPQRKVKQLIDEDVIGPVSNIHLSFSLVNFTKAVGGWRCDPKVSGGGPLMDLAPHLIHLACFFAQSHAESVMAYVHPDQTESEIETDAVAAMRFANGVTATMETSFARSRTHSYRITGSKGYLDAEGTMGWQVGGKIVLEQDFESTTVQFEQLEGIEQEFREFASAIEHGTPLLCDGRAGLHVQAVIDAVYESGRTGRRCPVSVDR